MTSALQRIFGEAIALPREEQAAFLARECGGDEALRKELQALLDAHNDGSDFLTSPSFDLPGHVKPPVGSDESGTSIGRYRLLQRLGEGGFGVVYLAEQTEPVRRRVALKLIKPGMDSRAVIARFEQERQALAVMDHPNVARVLDAGTTDRGLPFFVMELVKGEPITRYCDLHNLAIRQRLELFINVCEATQHAHMKGIIHRDIKPGNVLVAVGDHGPVVKVIDFGVAKALAHTLTEQTIFTEHGALIGTPEYMSPEQAEMGAIDIDTRTDVYSLGVLLYELLTGATPFDPQTLRARGFDEIRRIIREVDPPKPSTRFSELGEKTAEIARHRQSRREELTRQLSRELDWIPLKAMRKDRTERYRTPTDLADDIRNYLEGKPLEAGPESATYRLRKFVRRNRAAVAVVSTVIVALLVGVIGLTWGLYSASVARAAEAEQRAVAEEQRAIAEQREEEALEAVQRALAAEAQAQQRAEELDTVAALQERAIAEIDSALMGLRIRQSIIDKRRAVLHGQGVAEPMIDEAIAEFAGTLAGVNFTNVALEALEENILSRSIHAVETELADQPEMQARLLQRISSTMVDLGFLARAEDLQGKALDTFRSELGDDHELTLAALNNMGVLLRILGQYDEAYELLQEALEGRRRHLGDDHPDTIASLNDVGQALELMKRYDEAVVDLSRALELRRQVLGADHRETLVTMQNLANVLHRQGEYAEAEAKYKEAAEGLERVEGPNSPYTLGARQNRATNLWTGLRRSEEAKLEFQAIIEGLRESLGDLHPQTLAAASNLSVLLHYQHEFDEAQQYQRLVLEGRREVLGDDHPDTMVALHNLAYTLGIGAQHDYGAGRVPEAIQKFREAIHLLSQIVPVDEAELDVLNRNLAFALFVHGSEMREQARWAEAESALLESHARYAECFGPTHSETRGIGSHVASLYEKWHEAEPDADDDYAAKAAEWRAKVAAADPEEAGDDTGDESGEEAGD